MSRTNDLICLRDACSLVPTTTGHALHRSTLLRWIQSGYVYGVRIGGRWFVSREELLALGEAAPREPPCSLLPTRAEARRRERETRRVLEEAGYN